MSEDPHVLTYHGRKIAKFEQGNANYCAITDSGTRAIATSNDGLALAIDLEPKKAIQVQAFTKHTSSVQQCALTSFGRAAATASLDGTVRVWNTERPSQEWKKLTYRDYNRALGVALSRDGTTIAAYFQKRSNQSGVIVVYSMPEFERITWWKTRKLDLFSGAIAISDDGAIVAHCSKIRAYAVQVQAAKQLGVNDPKSHKRWPVCGESHVAMSGDGCTLVVADNNSLRVLGLADNQVIELEGYHRSFRPFCTISQSGNRIASAVRGDKFRIWDSKSGKIITDVGGFEHHARGCALSQDGNILLTCSFDKAIFITKIDGSSTKKSKEELPSSAENIDVGSNDSKTFSYEVKELTPVITTAEIKVIGNENEHSRPEVNTIEDSSPKDPEIEFGRQNSGKVSKLIQQLEDISKRNDIAEAGNKNFDQVNLQINQVRQEKPNSDSDERSAEVQTDASTSEILNAIDEQESNNIDNSSKSRPDPRAVFSSALERNERVSDGNLLHTQASEALEELFESSDLERIGKYTRDDALLSSDIEKRWRINERQFIEAAIKVMTAIQASKTDKWTAAFIGAAEDLENSLTVPQAASLIFSVVGESCPEKETIFTALENSLEPNGEVDFKSFMSSVQKLGFNNK